MQRSAAWKWGDQDGGRGKTGLVEEVRPDGGVWVRWAHHNYKNVYAETDLLVLRYVQDINIGDIVERGPSWQYGDQDGGVGKKGIVMKITYREYLEVFCKWENGKEANYRWGAVQDIKVVKSIR